MQDRRVVVPKRGPHDPPAVVNTLDRPTIRTGTTVKRIRNKTFGIDHGNPTAILSKERRQSYAWNASVFNSFPIPGETLPVKKIFFPQRDKRPQPLFPVFGDPSRILPRDDRIEGSLM